MITPNQAIALYHLRRNPNNHRQTTHQLLNNCGERCALGLVAEAFNIPVTTGSVYNGDAYNSLGEKLGPQYHVVYALNDEHGLTYEEVADVMEHIWENNLTPYNRELADLVNKLVKAGK